MPHRRTWGTPCRGEARAQSPARPSFDPDHALRSLAPLSTGGFTKYHLKAGVHQTVGERCASDSRRERESGRENYSVFYQERYSINTRTLRRSTETKAEYSMSSIVRDVRSQTGCASHHQLRRWMHLTSLSMLISHHQQC